MKENDVYIGKTDNGAIIITKYSTNEWRCLPDTLHPRGPKAK